MLLPKGTDWFSERFFYGLSKKNGTDGTYQNNPALSLKLHNSIYHVLEGGAPKKVKMKMKVASTSITPPHTVLCKANPATKETENTCITLIHDDDLS